MRAGKKGGERGVEAFLILGGRDNRCAGSARISNELEIKPHISLRSLV